MYFNKDDDPLNYIDNIIDKIVFYITPFSLKNGTLKSEKNIIAPFQA